MKIETTIDTILELMGRPAFCVKDGAVLTTNQSARNLGIHNGTEVASLLYSGKEEYAGYSQGHMFLTLWLNGECRDASVTLLSDTHLFLLDPEGGAHAFTAYARAARELRLPLGVVMNSSERLFAAISDLEKPELVTQMSYMNRGMYQLLRIVSNMSDAVSCGGNRMSLMDVTAVFSEILDKITMLCEHIDVQIRCKLHPLPLYSFIDEQKLERAVYNLLSNAIRNSRAGGVIEIALTQHKNNISISVSDSGNGSDPFLTLGAFERYLLEPGLDEINSGLGLGIPLIRSAALAHRGSFLMTPLPGGGTRSSISFPIRQDSSLFRSPTLRPDYTGEWDHGLVELSEFLPVSLYDPREA